MEVKASVRYARVGAQKARTVVDLVRGKDANEAVRILTFMRPKSAAIVKKLIESAIANADQKKTVDIDNLYVKSIWVDQGPVFKRFRPRAQGRAFGVRKKMSHFNVILEER